MGRTPTPLPLSLLSASTLPVLHAAASVPLLSPTPVAAVSSFLTPLPVSSPLAVPSLLPTPVPFPLLYPFFVALLLRLPSQLRRTPPTQLDFDHSLLPLPVLDVDEGQLVRLCPRRSSVFLTPETGAGFIPDPVHDFGRRAPAEGVAVGFVVFQVDLVSAKLPPP